MKSIHVLSITSLAALSLSACVNQTQTSLAGASNPNRSVQTIESAATIHHLDVGQGIKTSAKIAVSINTDTANFKTQASTNGAIAKVLADVDQYELFLFECTAIPTAGGAGSPTDLNSSPCSQKFNASVNSTGTATQSFVFENLAANTTGNRYFVGISAKETTPALKNITEFTGYNTTGTHPAPGAIAYSNGGGDSDGGVAVNASFALSNSAQLTVALPLLNAIGAKLDSQVTVTNGGTTLPVITVN